MDSSSRSNNSTEKIRCFFCFNDSEDDSDFDGDTNRDRHKLFLRNISRYLQLSKLDDFKKEMCSDSAWSICNNCFLLAVEFNELYHLLEVTKMELNWCLQRMHHVMTKVDNDRGDKVNGICSFRTAITGQIKNITPLPRVKVHRTQAFQENSVAMDLVEKSNSVIDIDPELLPATTSREDVVVKMECDVNDEISIVLSSSDIKTEEEEELLDRDKSPPTTPTLKCSLCRALFLESNCTGTKTGERLLHHHKIQYHCEQLFPNHRLDSVTESQFKLVLGGLLFKDLIQENKDTICLYCEQKFKCPATASARLPNTSKIKEHFIQFHFSELEKILEKIQRRPEINEKLLECNLGTICECGAYLQNKWSRATHDKWHCFAKDKQPKTPIFSSRKVIRPESISKNSKTKQLICNLCNKSFSRCNLDRHLKYYCAKREKLAVPEEGSLSCDYCSYKCPNRGLGGGKVYMSKHFLRYHPDHFFQNEKSQQELSKWKKDNFSDIVMHILFPKFIKSDGVSYAGCSLCETKYRNNSYSNNVMMLKRHLINQHKHELNKSLKVLLEETDASLKRNIEKDSVKVKNVRAIKVKVKNKCASAGKNTPGDHVGEILLKKECTVDSKDSDPDAID